MLASPGHSPRFISTPSSSSLLSLDTGKKQDATPSSTPHRRGGLMLPPPAKRPKRSQRVLDEDTYVAAIEKIIERDFFPDIPKLQNRLEWLEALRSGNPLTIRDAHLNIIQRRRDREMSVASDRYGTPAYLVDPFSTPSSIAAASPAPSLNIPLDPEPQPGDDSVDTSLSLDEFLKRYTSEDNASFSKIVAKDNTHRHEKYRFLREKEYIDPQLRLERGEYPTDGYGTSGQPESTLDTWTYRAKNLLMYDSAERDDAPLTESEKEERAKALTKEVNVANTRFHSKMFDSKTREEDTTRILYTPVPGGTPMPSWAFSGSKDAERLRKKYDLEELRQTPGLFERSNSLNIPKTGTSGYSYVATPSPAPGVDESPFMTWGEIQGTPLRLEAEDTPVGIGGDGDGPHFKIPAPPPRDARAHSLSRNAARNLREKARIYQGYVSPSPSRGSGSPALKSLSAAAQKFVRNAMAKNSGSIDVTLRASYRANLATGTPKMSRHAMSFSRESSISSRECSVSLPSPEEHKT